MYFRFVDDVMSARNASNTSGDSYNVVCQSAADLHRSTDARMDPRTTA